MNIKKKYILLFISLLVTLSGWAQIKGKVTGEEQLPLVGAHILWEGTSIGVVTNENGEFEISPLSDHDQLVVRYIGYKPDTVEVKEEYLTIRLKATTLETVRIVAESSRATTPSYVAIQTQEINYGELCRAACCNLGESFETNPSVDVSYSDANTGARQIKLLGLSGSYVQMLTEKIPNFRGLAAPYGLGYIPGPWMESIQISKGTSSVVDGFESLTGQINVEYKKPQTSDPLSVNLFGSSALRFEANADAAFVINPKLSTMVFGHYENDTKEHDGNNDGFLDQPRIQQFNIFNRWNYKTDNFISQLGFRFLNEDRKSGQVSGWQTDKELYKIGIKTNRFEIFAKEGFIFNPEKNTSLGIILSGSYHDQESFYGKTMYDAGQTNFYTNVIFQTEITPTHHFKGGGSIIGDLFRENLHLNNLYGSEFTENDQDEVVPGVFAEYTFNLPDKFVAMAGIRADYHNTDGFFVTPRVHLKYDAFKNLHFRGSIGKGYRTSHVLAENNYLLASNRKIIVANNLKREDAWNYGISATAYIPLKDDRFITIVGEWYYTNFVDQVVMDLDTDPHVVSFYNLDGRSYSNNFQLEVTCDLFRGFSVTAAHRITDAKMTINGELKEKPLTNRFKSLLTMMYQTPLKKWQFDFTAQVNGKGRMPDPDPVNSLWDKEFKTFPVFNVQVTKNFKKWSLYGGSENLFNFTQENPIVGADDPWGENFDGSMVWGPVHGRKIYLGLRWNL
jgi:outer membrane receptor for ferrienterochelin and colicin